tara:strand:+ start:661 stop:1941 length:1281 start_codon:yes stop_codon:yes gene_type:complete
MKDDYNISIKNNIGFFDLIKSKFCLDISYLFFIAPFYSYMGFTSEFSLENFFYSIIILFFFSSILQLSQYFLSDYLKTFIFHVLFLPSLTMFTFQSISPDFFLKWLIIFVFFIIIFNQKIVFKSAYQTSFLFKNYMIYGLLLFSFFLYSYYFGTNLNFQYFALLSDTLYEGRESFSVAGSKLGMIRYFFSNIQNVALPLFLSYGLYKKNKILVLLTFALYMYVFLTTTLKTILFTPILILFTYFILRDKSIYIPHAIFKNFYKVILAAIVIDYFLYSPYIHILFIRRLLFLPVLVSEKYFQYFDENNFTYLSDLPLFESLFIYPFDGSIPNIIGKYFIYNSGYMNGSFLADGYIKIGLLSVFLYIIFLKLFTSLVDKKVNFDTQFIIFSVVFASILALTNSSMTTTLFSHGLLISFFVSSQVKGAI